MYSVYFFPFYLCCFAIASALISYIGWILSEDFGIRRQYRFPPIVPGLPIVGNAFQIPKTDQGPYLQKLGEKYGEMWVFFE